MMGIFCEVFFFLSNDLMFTPTKLPTIVDLRFDKPPLKCGGFFGVMFFVLTIRF